MLVPVGAPVTGEYFINRENEIKEILDALKKESVLIIAPRRFGKTSLMKEVLRRIGENGDVSIYIDAEAVYTPQQFIVELTNSFLEISEKKRREHIIKNILSILGQRIQEIDIFNFRIKLKEELSKESWIEKGNDIINSIVEEFHDRKICIAVDEIPECIKGIASKDKNEALKVLKWLRSIRQKCSNVRFIFGGSISFERVVADLGDVAVINDLRRIKISGFSKEDALKMIKNALDKKGIKYDENVAEEILNCVGEPYVPFFIAVMLSIMENHLSEPITKSDVKEIYELRVLGTEGKGYFEHYKYRLKNYPFSNAAMKILKEVSKVERYPVANAYDIFKRETGLEDEEKFNNLINDLENDFYIVREGQYIKFYIKILKDWWRSYYG